MNYDNLRERMGTYIVCAFDTALNPFFKTIEGGINGHIKYFK